MADNAHRHKPSDVAHIREGLIPADELRVAVGYMKLLSHPARLQIVKMLSEQDLCVCVIEAALKRNQPNVSQHLSKLKDNNVIESYPVGKFTYYRLKDKRILDLIKNLSK